MSYITNAPESANLSKEDTQVFEAARTAAASLAKTFELWITIARAVELARIKADKIGRRNAFQRILEQQGLAGVLGNTWPSQMSTATRLLAILARLPEVEAWRETLTGHQRISWSAPTTLFKHCPVFAKDRPEREDAAALAKVDRIGRENSGIDWAPQDEAEMLRALSEARVKDQKQEAEIAEMRTRMGAMEMVDRATATVEPPGDSPYLAALQSEIETLKAENARLQTMEAGLRFTMNMMDKDADQAEALIEMLEREIEKLKADSAGPTTFQEAVALALQLGAGKETWPGVSAQTQGRVRNLCATIRVSLSELGDIQKRARKAPAKKRERIEG